MKKAVYLMALGLLLAIPAASGEETDRQAVVRALLDRSRLLADTHFSIPADLWRKYQVSIGAERGEVPSAPVPFILELGQYRLAVAEDGGREVTATVRLHVIRPDQCVNVPVLSASMAWEKVAFDGKEATPATADGWLRLSPDRPGPIEVSATVKCAAVGRAGSARTLQARCDLRFVC